MPKSSRTAALLGVVLAAAVVTSIGAAVTASGAVPHPSSAASVICRSGVTKRQVEHQLLRRLQREVDRRYRPAARSAIWRRLVRHPATAYRTAKIWAHVRVVAVVCRTRTSHRTVYAVVPARKAASVGAALTAASTAGRRLGISDPVLFYLSAADQSAQLADMKKNLHAASVRFDVPWPKIQPDGPTSFDWSKLDQVVASVRAKGMGIDFILDGCAPWASPSGNWWAQPSDPAQFAAFAGAVAARYRPAGVDTFEIWNEPNLDQFWYPVANAHAYTALLVDASAAIKAADPSAKVISGGLIPGGTPSGASGGIHPLTFLATMYADGAKSSFDAVGFHPYSGNSPSSRLLPLEYAPWSGFSEMSATKESVRSIMVANGDSAKKLDITEVGWPSNESTQNGIAGPAAQADEFSEVLSFAAANRWVGSVYLYTYQDNGMSTTIDENNYGLVTAKGVRKPAYYVVAGWWWS
jgi:polysaccharide biosynthesis protein PslG